MPLNTENFRLLRRATHDATAARDIMRRLYQGYGGGSLFRINATAALDAAAAAERVQQFIANSCVLPRCSEDSCHAPATERVGRFDWCLQHSADIVACDACNTIVGTDEARSLHGDTLCDECYDESHADCEGCGETFEQVELSVAGLCDSCQAERDARSELVFEYDRDPLDILSFLDANGSAVSPRDHADNGYMVYGVELEIETRGVTYESDARRTLEQLEDFAILKRDGSLDCGFEIVTAPAPLEFHAHAWRQFKPSGNMESSSTETCGLHVHISRALLKPLQVGKMLVFLNAPENTPFIQVIAQRNPERWAKIAKKGFKDIRYPESRYEALNLTRTSTVELRIFKGNMRYDRIMKAVEFADALVAFTAPLVSSAAQLSTSAFCALVDKERKRWPNLSAFLVEKGYLLPKPEKNKCA